MAEERDSERLIARAATIAGALIYVPVLRFAYREDVHPLFDYMGYSWRDIPAFEHFLLWLLAALPALWMPIRLLRPSQVAYWFLYLFVVIPSILIPAYLENELPGGPIAISVLILAAFFGLSLIYKIPLLKIRAPKAANTRSWLLMAFLGLIALLYLFVFNAYGFPKIKPTLDLQEIYEVRLDFGGGIAQRSRFVGYAIPWLSEVINPLMLVWGIYRRSATLIVVGVMGQLVLFSVTAHKTYLFSPLFVPLLILTMRKQGRDFGLWMIYGPMLVVLISIIEMRTSGSGLPNTLFVRRMYIAPGLLTARYLEYFTNHAPAMLGHSILGGLVPYPHEDVPARLVGRTYFGPYAHANANVWADAYANFRFVGIFAFTVLLGGALYLYDSVAARSDLRVTAVLMGMPAVALSNTGLLTALLSHGMGLATLIAYLLPVPQARGSPKRTRAESRGRAGRARGSPAQSPARSAISSGVRARP